MKHLPFLAAAGTLAIIVAVPQACADTRQDFEVISDIGALAIPLAAGALALYRDDRDGAIDLGLTWGAAVGASWALKKSVGATRPNGEPESFPSRHAASAFAGASYLQYRYGWNEAVPAYVAALAVGYARVEADEHHWRDIAMSAALANLSAWLLTSRHAPPIPVTASFDPATDMFELRSHFRF